MTKSKRYKHDPALIQTYVYSNRSKPLVSVMSPLARLCNSVLFCMNKTLYWTATRCPCLSWFPPQRNLSPSCRHSASLGSKVDTPSLFLTSSGECPQIPPGGWIHTTNPVLRFKLDLLCWFIIVCVCGYAHIHINIFTVLSCKSSSLMINEGQC